jgi:hypothetical protein
MDFFTLLQQLLEKHSVQKLALSSYLGVSRTHLYRQLDGEYPPPPWVLVGILEFCQKDPFDKLDPEVVALYEAYLRARVDHETRTEPGRLPATFLLLRFAEVGDVHAEPSSKDTDE